LRDVKRNRKERIGIGVDVGGTNIVCGAVTEDGEVAAVLKRPTDARQGPEAVIGRIAAMVREVVGRLDDDAAARVAAVGVGTPGLVDPERGVSLFAGNLGWRNVPLAERLGAAVGLPVCADNDVRMYVYGEYLRGAAAGERHVLGVTVGTGLACAVVEGGRLYYGGGFMAGELGHIRFPDIPYACGCGLTGCLETAASATGIVRQAVDQLKAGRDSALRALCPDGDWERLTAAHVSEGARRGDPLCADVMRRTGDWLGRGLAIAATLFSPDVIVVGGGAALAGDLLLGPARRRLEEDLMADYRKRLRLVRARRIEDAGVVGSALYALQRANLSGG
jgi:glucokinase